MEIMNSDDRVFTIKPKEGTSSKTSTGLIDNRLFKGGNALHAVQDSATLLWTLKYEIGGLPEGLKNQKWSKFDLLLQDVVRYFDKRGLTATYEHRATSSNR